MGRPKKKGLDYFSLDTTWDTSMRLLKAKFGLEGIGCMIELYKTIYQEGYYIQWDADAKLLFSCEHHISIDRLDDIIQEAFQREMLDQTMFKVHRILTSRGIQKRWKFIMASMKRTDTEIESLYDLLSIKQIAGQQFDNFVEAKEKTPLNSDFIGVNTEETIINSGFSAQRKGKEKKGNETKRKESIEGVFFSGLNPEQSNQESDFPFRDPPLVQNPNRVNTDTTNRIETARTIWNATDGLPKYRFMAISIPPDNLHPILRMLGQYSDDEVQQAIRNYADIISRSDLNPFPKYTNFAGFLAKGIELYCDEAKPYERCKKASGFETAQEKEDRERKAALAYSRKLDEEYQRQQELAECEDD
jgi:hypothetical protein